jgi:hypothetical protein
MIKNAVFGGNLGLHFFCDFHFGIKRGEFGKIIKSVEMERIRHVSQLLEKAKVTC